MLLAFAVVLFTIAVYMGLDAVTVRQKQIEGSLSLDRRYGGASLPRAGQKQDVTSRPGGATRRETDRTKDVTNRLIAPAARKLAGPATALPMTQNPDEIRRRL